MTSNVTRSPSASVLEPEPWIAEKWSNTSSPPSWEMKPKPVRFVEPLHGASGPFAAHWFRGQAREMESSETTQVVVLVQDRALPPAQVTDYGRIIPLGRMGAQVNLAPVRARGF